MARRRRLARGLSGLGEGISSVASMLLANKLQTQRQGELAKASREHSLITTLLPKVLSGDVDPEQLGGVLPADQLERMQPPARRRLAPVGQEIASATSPTAVPTELGLRRRFLERGVQPEQVTGAETSPGFGGFPMVTGDITSEQHPDFERLLAEANEKRSALTRAQDRKPVTRIVNGQQVTEYKTNEELGDLGQVRTERTPEEEGTRQATVTSATEQARTDVQNNPKNVKAFVDREAAVAYARQLSQQKADKAMGAGDFKPQYEIVETKGEDGNKVYMVIDKTQTDTVDSGLPSETVTDSMRDSAAYAERARSSHNLLLQLEPVLAKRGLALTLAQVNAPEAITDPVVRQYAQATREFINAQARDESGASIGEKEWANYQATSAWKPGDDDQTLQNKWSTRRRTIAGLALKSGQSLGRVFVTKDELEQLAELKGTTVEEQAKAAEAAGYKVIH